jgi:hypothetical protein
MTEQNNNIVTTEDILPKKKQTKKQDTAKVKSEIVLNDKQSKVLVYFETGTAYILQSGRRFDQNNKMLEVSTEEVSALLRLQNFRLPNDEEKEFYYNSLEV